MLKQALIVLGLLLVFGCANPPDKDKQLITGGCSESLDSIEGGSGESISASKSAFFDSTNFDTSDFQD